VWSGRTHGRPLSGNVILDLRSSLREVEGATTRGDQRVLEIGRCIPGAYSIEPRVFEDRADLLGAPADFLHPFVPALSVATSGTDEPGEVTPSAVIACVIAVAHHQYQAGLRVPRRILPVAPESCPVIRVKVEPALCPDSNQEPFGFSWVRIIDGQAPFLRTSYSRTFYR